MTESNPQPRKRRRARKPDGTFKGDLPGTETNEAWEPTPIESALPKEENDKYTVKPKVDGVSSNSAGKYGKKPKVGKPGFGSVSTVQY